MHRFFLTGQDSVSESEALIVSKDLIHQFVRVLRFKAGERIVLLDNSGVEFEVELGGEVEGRYPKGISGKVIDKRVCKTELPFRLVLAFAILRNPEKIEWILQKGTELGVSRFVPFLTMRTEKKSLFKVERLRRILKEAAEQSGRGIIPELGEIVEFTKFLSMQQGFVVVPHPSTEKTFKNLDFAYVRKANEVVVCIGPEGGFTEKEIDFGVRSGVFLINLGPRILRAETAAVLMAGILAQIRD